MTKTTKKPILIMVTGVSGSGKSTLANALAKQFNFTFLEADDFHSKENKAHMASGKALTDEMRLPWVADMKSALEGYAKTNTHCSLAFSGLKRAHRKILEISCFDRIHFFLKGSAEDIAPRMEARKNHFMPTSLLQSQFDALESPEHEPDVINLDISASLEDNLSLATKVITNKLSANL